MSGSLLYCFPLSGTQGSLTLLVHQENANGRYKMAIADPPCVGENGLQTTCMHVDDSGNMVKFIRQKKGAECEHSEEFVEVDKRH